MRQPRNCATELDEAGFDVCGKDIPFVPPEGGKFYWREQCKECYEKEKEREERTDREEAPRRKKRREETQDQLRGKLLSSPAAVLRACGTPPRVAEVAGEHWEEITARPGLPSLKDSVFIHGPCGIGKSVMAAALLFRWLLEKTLADLRTVDGSRFQSAPRFLMELRRGFGRADEEAADPRRALELAPFLVLDDFGVEKTTDWSFEELYALIDFRYERDAPTIVSSNLSLDELTMKMGDDRIPSRISGWCKKVHLTGGDLRQRGEK